MELRENPYGVRKRLLFIEDLIREVGARRVLDVGCGTGEYLTRPLAARLPHVSFTGTDSDPGSIAAARAGDQVPNLRFLPDNELPEAEQFDLAIASEVIEHVPDPVAFLRRLATRTGSDGWLIVTLPNGFGPAEQMALLEDVLRATGAFAALRWLKRALLARRSSGAGVARADSLADSPHTNFFTLADIHGVVRAAGLREIRLQPRTWLCGFGVDYLLRGQLLLSANARLTDALPPAMASDWMLVLRPDAPETSLPGRAPDGYHTRWYARLRRRIHAWRRVVEGRT